VSHGCNFIILKPVKYNRHGPVISSGYYGDQVKTDEVDKMVGYWQVILQVSINKDGSASLTGKNIFKLSQGEYVSSEQPIQFIYIYSFIHLVGKCVLEIPFIAQNLCPWW
jgi:hypothetical protein